MMENRNVRASFQGVVVSTKMNKTIVVQVETHKKHAKYGKRVQFATKFYAHDENNTAKAGDVVTIAATRPISKLKRFRLVSVDKVALESIKVAEAELKLEEQAGVVSAEPVVAPVVEEKKVTE
jgi:small subunit ribosomal protein S17